MKLLNLYSCLGGNRKLWGDDHEIVAVEKDPFLAGMYEELYPNDTVIVGDAHEYLRKNYMNFDFIWSSPPCPSHSRSRFWNSSSENSKTEPVFPDLKLYEEILFLKHYFKGKYCVENVIPYYTPLVPAKKRGRHLYWTNFHLPNDLGHREDYIISGDDEVNQLCKFHDVDISPYKGTQRKDKIMRNLVDYHAGKTILDTVLGIVNNNNEKQISIFDQI